MKKNKVVIYGLILILFVISMSVGVCKAQITYQHDKAQIQQDNHRISNERDSINLKRLVDSTLWVLHNDIYFYYMDSIYGKYNLTKKQLYSSDNNASYWMKTDCYMELLDYLDNGELLKWIRQYWGEYNYARLITIDELYDLVKGKKQCCEIILLKHGYKID